MRPWIVVCVVACGGSSSSKPDGAVDDDAAPPDAASLLGTVSNVADVTCPTGAVPGATCKTLTVECPGIAPLGATIAIATGVGTTRGTIVHLSGGGGTGFQTAGAQPYRNGGFRQIFVAWADDWEQTTSGIKAGGCRPATLLKYIFDEPTLHAGSRTLGFCGEGFSGGSGQLGYALAHYGIGEYLDYVNELSGPPFARIDLGCDGNAPATAVVCGDTVTMRLPSKLDGWENNTAPGTCGAANVPAADLARWKADSIAVGGVYEYPKTRVEFFDCTNQATAVTAMAQLYSMEMQTSTGGTQYHCYTAADGCQGEGLGTGAMDAIQAMIAGCIARH